MRRHKWIWLVLLLLFLLIAPHDAQQVILALTAMIKSLLLAIVSIIHSISTAFHLH